jgi:hypothetical protein
MREIEKREIEKREKRDCVCVCVCNRERGRETVWCGKRDKR